MHVCYITSQLPYPTSNGGTVKTLATLTALVREGHEVHLFCFGPKNWQDPVRELQKLGVRSVFCHPRELVWEKAWIKHGIFFLRSFLHGTPYTLEKFRHPNLKNAINRFIKKKQPDMIWVDHFNLIPYLPSWFSGISVLEEHNIQSLLFSRLAEQEKNPFLREIYRMESEKWESYERNHLQRFSVIGTISGVDRDYFVKHFGLPRVRFLGTAVSAPHNRPRRKKQLLFIGRLTWKPNRQGLTWFLEHVWPGVRQGFPDYKLVVVGDYVRTLPVFNGVSFLGSVPAIKPYLLTSSALVCPIFSGSGIRIKILQALASGLPVISTRLGAEGIPVVHSKSAILADTSGEFSEGIKKVLTEESLSASMSKEAKLLARKHFSPAVFQRRLHEIIKEISIR